jgi:hypothetical protein
MKLISATTVTALLIGSSVALAQNTSGGAGTSPSPSPIAPAGPTAQSNPNQPGTVGQAPGVNPSNPQDLSNRSNPQDMTRPGANNPQNRR